MTDAIYIRNYPESKENYPALGPLAGLEYVVKDIVSVKDYPVTFGLNPPFVGLALENAAIVDLLKSKGANLIASTNLEPAAMSISGKNPYYGNMINPISENLPLGGSSGGSATAVATAGADFGIGSDHGGSVRIPAAMCNLSGIKLTPGLIDTSGCILLDDHFDCLGFIAESPANLNFILDNIVAFKSIPPVNRLVIPGPEDFTACNTQVKNEFYAALENIRKSFEVIEIEKSLNFSEINRLRKIIVSKLFSELIKQYDIKMLPSDLQAILIYSESISSSTLRDAANQAIDCKAELTHILGTGSLLLTPLFPISTADIYSADQPNYFLNLANIAGFPALTCRPHEKKTALQMQLVGPPFSELSLCRTAEVLEKL
jgi:aspartyl-tRNA(Asn)/glutamyl-tRNA(Gln) amidotransferase subunit A